MPISVDHHQRRDEIMDAAIEVLGEGGLKHLTLRAVGQRLGGSATLVTHYFPSRDALLAGMLERTLEDARETQGQLVAIEDPHERLSAVIRYFLPFDESELAIERARVALASSRRIDPAIQLHYERIEPGMRELVRRALEDFVPPQRLPFVVDLVRLWTSGMVLSVIEQPEIWTRQRQLEALRHLMELIELPLASAADAADAPAAPPEQAVPVPTVFAQPVASGDDRPH